ncbi:UDP-N-acetylmuramate--L-alanine ligase [Actinomycetaceae bacterium TAE3-ERU4]|nr:UDP-N-acetylmuramate--L-alanine ligase [Actinomycetaceae bacterium TAE3-ERU4]
MADFHFIGILGSGMNVIAHLLLDQGFTVSGSDRSDNAYLAKLVARGAKVYIGHEEKQVEDAKRVVYSSAIRETNPEMKRARELGIEVLHRSQALKFAAGKMRFAAVAGTHGKTTTSAMLATCLEECGLNPSYAIGSTVKKYGSGGHVGTGDIFVAEADESDESFLNYDPALEIITNIEADHLNHYGTFENIKKAFAEFVSLIKPGGNLVYFGDDSNTTYLNNHLQEGVNAISYGHKEGNQVRIVRCEEHPKGQDVYLEGALGNVVISLQMTGVHNARNAAGAWAAARALGVGAEEAANALSSFEGTKRRFELVDTIEIEPGADAVRVFDDYAHHPAEIVMAVAQARATAGKGRVILAFEPLLYTRTEEFQKEFAQAMDPADITFILDICAAREDERDDVTPHTIGQHMNEYHYAGSQAQAPALIAKYVRPGDLVMTMGCGNVAPLAVAIAKEIREQRHK